VQHAVFGALCVLGSAAASPAWAQGQSVSSVLANFGFFGTWAMHCGAPPAPTNIVQTVPPSGRGPVEFSDTVAPGTPGNRYRVLSARMAGPTTLVLRVELNRGSIEDLAIVKSGNWVRTMTNQRSPGAQLVRDGIILANGRRTPWLQKCQ